MARSVSFRKVSNPFQNKLACDVKTINSSPDLFVSADKTTNLYNVKVNNDEKLLQDSITTKYRKSNGNIVRQINLEAKQLAKNLKLDNRIEQLPEKPAFITLKDHKPKFVTNLKCRLINQTKSNLEKVSKHILDRINISICQSTGLQQWRNTTAVISWFDNFPNKEKCKFLSFDVMDFYPSISEELLSDAIDFARQFVGINDDEVNIILHCRKSILFGSDVAWIKKNSSLFDVAMGSFDGAEICELVGLFLLNNLTQLVGSNNIGLYRDDGLAILENASGPSTESIKKRIIKLFQHHGLKITAETNLVQTNFLDVTLDLGSGRYWPFRKPND